MGCDCGKPKCDGHCGVSPAVLQINNPSECVLFHRVEVPASMGDSKTNPPKSGAYKNVLLFYEADQTSWLYSSDGVPQKLVNGLTNYEDAINLPQINGVTLIGDKNSTDLKLADAPMVITVADGNASWSGADTAEDVYNFFLNKGKVNIVFNGGENYAYEIASAAYIPEEEKMMCTLAVAAITSGETAEFEGNALFGTMTLYTADKAIDVSQIELQPKLYIADFTGLDLNYDKLSGLPATTYSIGMVKPGDGLSVSSDGTLTVIDHVFDTVADMKASTELKNGDYAQTLGFHTLNDGGGATYYISDSGTADEMQVIAVGDLYANLVLTGEVTPEMFGAYGDNSHDDSASIQKAFDSGRVVRLLHKTYLTNSTINISGDYVEFNGTEGTIKYTGALNAILFGKIDHAKINLGRVLADDGNCIRAYSATGLTAPADYIVYLDLHFEQLRAKYKCISFETTGTGFINEVRLYGGNFSGGEYGVHYVADVNHNFTGTDGFYCYNLCFEGTDNNYYFESPYHRFRGIECINDRYVENTTSTHITLVGNFTSCHWQSWGNMDESRIDLSQANVKLNLNFDFPILNSDASATFADGIKYDIHSRKSYVFSEYIRHYPSGYGSHVTGGAVRCYKVNNMCYLELKGVIGDATSFEILDAAHKLPFQFIPTEFERSYSCTTPDGYNGVVNVLTDGTLTIWTNSSASIGKPFYGTLVYDPMINTNPS